MTKDILRVYNTLNDIEVEFDLFSRTVDGVQYWERIRNEIYKDICNEIGAFGKSNADVGQTWKQRFRGLYLLLRNLAVRNPYLVDEHEVLFYSHPRRKKHPDGTWWDLYSDPILEELDLDAISVEYDHELKHYSPARSNPLKYTDLIEYTGTIYKMVSGYSLPNGESKYLTEVEKSIEAELGVEIDVVGKARDQLAERRILIPLYELLLSRIDPKVVVLVVSYGKESFIESCQKIDIPVVELQHGSISKYHYGYSFPVGVEKETFPDYFFTFGSFWRNRFELPLDDRNVYDVGYPYLEQTANQIDRSGETYPTSERQILFISQGTIGEELSKFATKVSELVSDDWTILYKLHPDEYSTWKNRYPWLIDTSVEIFTDDSASLYELFEKVDAQVGVYSTAIYEGLYFGLSTYILETEGIHYVQDLIDEGIFTPVSSPDQLADELENTDVGEYDPTRFFNNNAVEEFQRRLDQIIDEKS
jgi:hypothetical protein